MKKLLLSSAAMVMAFSFSAIAGTPENNKSEAKAKTEAKTTYIYHFVSEDDDENVTFEEGPALSGCNPGSKACEWESDQPMDTNSTLKDAQIRAQADLVTQTRN